jgi:hypothetical protein
MLILVEFLSFVLFNLIDSRTAFSGWVDPDTVAEKRKIVSYTDGGKIDRFCIVEIMK